MSHSSVAVLLCPDRREGGNKRCFCPSVCLSVCLSVAYITNYSRTHRPSVLIFGRKFPHLRCDLHTSFKVKRSKVRLLVCNSLKYKLCILRIEEVSCSLAMIISAHEINKIASLMICVYVA